MDITYTHTTKGIRFRIGDRVTLRWLPGHYRVTGRDGAWIWITGLDSQSLDLCSLSPSCTVGVRRSDLVLDTTTWETLL